MLEHIFQSPMAYVHASILGLVLAHMHGVRFSFKIWRNGSATPRLRWQVYIAKDNEKH